MRPHLLGSPAPPIRSVAAEEEGSPDRASNSVGGCWGGPPPDRIIRSGAAGESPGGSPRLRRGGRLDCSTPIRSRRSSLAVSRSHPTLTPPRKRRYLYGLGNHAFPAARIGMACTCVVGLQWGDEAKG